MFAILHKDKIQKENICLEIWYFWRIFNFFFEDPSAENGKENCSNLGTVIKLEIHPFCKEDVCLI